jgi:hypothetical protein
VLRPALRRAAPLLALAAALAACAQTLKTHPYPALSEQKQPVASVAVVPFAFRGQGGLAFAVRDDSSPRDAASRVARYVSEALEADRLRVVAPEDVMRALSAELPDDLHRDPEAVAQLLAEEFGVDAVLFGTLRRFRDRSGTGAASGTPASVGIDVTLYRASDAERLWSASFDETQQPLTSNLLNAFRYPSGGTRWLTADEIGRWAAQEVAAGLPRSP